MSIRSAFRLELVEDILKRKLSHLNSEYT